VSFSAQHIKAARLHLTSKTRRDRFGSLVRSIVSQQISTHAAKTILGRLEEGVGKRQKTPKKRGQNFCPETILTFEVDELRELGVSRQKATYLQSLAQHVVDGDVDLAKVSKMTDEEAIENLTQIKGIGRWTVEVFLIFSLGRLDVLPAEDLGIKTAAKNIYRLRELPDRKRLEKIAKPWRPYASVASWYLWRSLELKE